MQTTEPLPEPGKLMVCEVLEPLVSEMVVLHPEVHCALTELAQTENKVLRMNRLILMVINKA
jgi:hypothetical protein